MRLEGCVRRDITMDLEGPHAFCMFISIGLLPLETMSADAHSMMMSVFMGSMTPRGSADLQTSLQISLTRGSSGCASALGIHTHTCESCVGKYYTSNLSLTGGHP